MDKIVFFIFVLPFLIVHEGYVRFGKGLKSKDFWERAPYILLIVLFVLLVALWLQGYHF